MVVAYQSLYRIVVYVIYALMGVVTTAICIHFFLVSLIQDK